MRLIILLVFILLLVLSLGSCRTTETKPNSNEQYDKPIRERPIREYNDFHRGKGRP